MRRIAAAAVSAGLMITTIFATPASATSTPPWHVQVGSGGFTGGAFDGRGGNAFYPGTIAVHPGDKILFNLVSPHTVTFNAPPVFKFALFSPTASAGTLAKPGDFVNTGFDPTAPPSPFTLTIGGSLPPGSYRYICMLHSGMAGTIKVLPLSERLPKTDDEYAAIASREIARDLATAAEIAAEAKENDEDEDGSPTVSVGAGDRRVTNIRFFPATVRIHVGQTVTFVKTHDPTEPHTVSFGPEVGPPPTEFFPAGPTTTGSPSTQVHSGWLLTQKQVDFYAFAASPFPVAARTKFRVTFTAPGEYDYICAIHDQAGMRAKIIVR
jgi:plastocyanin